MKTLNFSKIKIFIKQHFNCDCEQCKNGGDKGSFDARKFIAKKMKEEAHKYEIRFQSKDSSRRRKRGALGFATDSELNQVMGEVTKMTQVNKVN